MKLYVGNLSFSTTDPDLKDLFAEYGTVTDVHLVTDRMTGKSRGFAFVTMSSAAEGKAAIAALEGKNLDGRNLTVNEARPKDEGAKRSLRSHAGRQHPVLNRRVSQKETCLSVCSFPGMVNALAVSARGDGDVILEKSLAPSAKSFRYHAY